MATVRIVSAGVAHPPYRVPQAEAARQIGLLVGDRRRVAAIARGTKIASRAVTLPPDELAKLDGIEERNRIYQETAPALALDASKAALGESSREHVGCVVTSSCTGYSVPGWSVQLVEQLGLRGDTARLPITESGCAGGAVALVHAVNYLRAHAGASALTVAAELCSLSFHAGGGDGNITSTLIFGDGAGACLLQASEGPGLRVLDSMTMLIPSTRDALGFDLTGHGFYPVLRRELVALLPPAVEAASAHLLARNRLSSADVRAWLLHPGGARILSAIEARLGLTRGTTCWSWDSMRDHGNTSSAAIFDVIRRYLESPQEPGPAVIAAFGPGVSVELLLVDRQC